MEWRGLCGKISKIKEKLQDEQSELLFDARLHYSITKDKWQLYEAVSLLEKEWYCPLLEDFLKQSGGNGIVIWGCGYDGREAKRALDVCGFHLDYFCDSNDKIIGTKIDGVPVISVDEMLEKCRDYSVIIGSSKYKDEMYEVLTRQEFPSDHILYVGYGHLQAHTGKIQYFDVFEPEENEVFIDAGSYDGGTILDFLQWTGGRYQKIIALEPLTDMHRQIEIMCRERNLRNIELHEAAAWNREEELSFTEDLTGSKVEEEGAIAIKGIALDHIVREDRVTFIKMDIEGSELKALEGARRIIQRDHPKLAISLYHKPEDIVELPAYILELVPEYKFYIRHYRSDVCETVLYAFV